VLKMFEGESGSKVPPASFSEEGLFFVITAGIIVFILWPVLAVLRESLRHEGTFSLANYGTLVSADSGLLWNSLSVGGLTVVFSLLLGAAIAFYISYTTFPAKKAVLAVLLMSIISPPFVSSLAYIMLFGRRGLITWKLLGIRWNPYGMHGVVLMESLGLATIAALLILVVLKGIDGNLEQASLDLGAGRGSTLLHITLPLAMPGIVTAGLIVFIRSLSDFGTPIIVGGNFNVLAAQAYITALGAYDMPMAAAICTVLLIPALAVFFIYRKVMGRTGFFGRSVTQSSGERFILPLYISLPIFILTWSFVIIEILKYGTIFWGAFANTWGVNFSLTLDHVKALKFSKMGSFARSIRYSLVAAMTASIMGIILAWFLSRRKGAVIRIIDFIVDLPFILPGPFFGIGYLLAFNWLPGFLFGSCLLVVANCTYRQLTIGAKSGISVLGQINPELEDVVRDQGGTQFHILKDVIFPLLKPAFLISFINTFTASMTTIGAIIFLVTPYTKVATVEMFESIQNGEIGQGAALASLIIIAVMFVNIIFSWFLTRGGNGKRRDGHVSSVAKVKQKFRRSRCRQRSQLLG